MSFFSEQVKEHKFYSSIEDAISNHPEFKEFCIYRSYKKYVATIFNNGATQLSGVYFVRDLPYYFGTTTVICKENDLGAKEVWIVFETEEEATNATMYEASLDGSYPYISD